MPGASPREGPRGKNGGWLSEPTKGINPSRPSSLNKRGVSVALFAMRGGGRAHTGRFSLQ